MAFGQCNINHTTNTSDAFNNEGKECMMNKQEKADIKKWLMVVTWGIVLLWLLEHYTLLGQGLGRVLDVLAPFIAGIALAYLLNLMMNSYERHVFWPLMKHRQRRLQRFVRPMAIVATLVTVAAILSLLLIFIIPQLAASISSLIDSVPGYRDSAMAWLEQIALRYPFLNDWLEKLLAQWQQIAQGLAEVISDLAPRLFSWTKSLTSGVITMVMGLIVSIYLLAGKEKYLEMLRKMLFAYLPQKRAQNILDVAALTNQSFSRFISGQLTEITILGCLCFIGMNIFRMPYPLLISVMIAVTALIPIFGAYMGTIPSAFLILMIDPMQAVWFVVFIICLQQIEGKIIYPKVVGSSIGLGGFWVLFALIVGGSLFGLPGMLIGIPIFAVCYTLVRQDMYKRLENKKETNEKVQ